MLPVAVFALLDQESVRNSTRSTVGVQLQVPPSGTGPMSKSNDYKNSGIINDCSLHGDRCPVYLCLFFQDGHKNNCAKSLHMPRQYEDVHANPDSDCYVLQVTTLNFIFIPVVMGMTLTMVSFFINTYLDYFDSMQLLNFYMSFNITVFVFSPFMHRVIC